MHLLYDQEDRGQFGFILDIKKLNGENVHSYVFFGKNAHIKLYMLYRLMRSDFCATADSRMQIRFLDILKNRSFWIFAFQGQYEVIDSPEL